MNYNQRCLLTMASRVLSPNNNNNTVCKQVKILHFHCAAMPCNCVKYTFCLLSTCLVSKMIFLMKQIMKRQIIQISSACISSSFILNFTAELSSCVLMKHETRLRNTIKIFYFLQNFCSNDFLFKKTPFN